MSNKKSRAEESQRITTDREFYVVNAIESEGKNKYKVVLGAMVDNSLPQVHQDELGNARYSYAIGDTTEDAWASTLSKIAGYKPEVKEYSKAFNEFKNNPSDENKAILAEKDVNVMREGKPMAYEKSLAMVASLVTEKKDQGFIEFSKTWTPSFKAQEERLKESFEKGNHNPIRHIANYKVDDNEYMPLENSIFAMEKGIQAKHNILSSSKDIMKRNPEGFQKNVKLLEVMAKDYSSTIGDNEISKEAMTFSKTNMKSHKISSPSMTL